MKTQFIVHPDEISKNLIDELVQNNVDCLGIHPVGGKDAYKTLEDLVLMLKTPEFRTLLDYAKDEKNNVILVKGNVPGAKNSYVVITNANKAHKPAVNPEALA